MFGGDTFDAVRDGERLKSQFERVRDLMTSGEWWTLADIALEAHCSEAGASARLRDLRKEKFGGYRIEREYSGNGLWKYRMLPPVAKPPPSPRDPLRLPSEDIAHEIVCEMLSRTVPAPE